MGLKKTLETLLGVTIVRAIVIALAAMCFSYVWNSGIAWELNLPEFGFPLWYALLWGCVIVRDTFMRGGSDIVQKKE